MNKPISIITNFGCQSNCWYCIWKQHPLKDVQLKTDWIKLFLFLYKNKKAKKVSISGGGDCLYKYSKHKLWWKKIFFICYLLNLKIDVHTREEFKNNNFWKKINKVVLSSDKILLHDIMYYKYLSKFTKVRIVHVITANTTKNQIKMYINMCKNNNFQLTFKQLSKYTDKGNYTKFKKIFPNEYFLNEGDYNIYYMPDNTITEKFI